ncbi:MAG TPA: hypothetical protein VK158_02065 [Acidobacteriota bacterium]|nr:hypothetical protein [Acidobacteriota bacterium]
MIHDDNSALSRVPKELVPYSAQQHAANASTRLALEYKSLLALTDDIVRTQPVLERGIAHACGGIPKLWHSAKRAVANSLNNVYEIPDVLEVVQLQRQQVQRYNQSLDVIAQLLDAQLATMRTEAQHAHNAAVYLQNNPSSLSHYAVKVHTNASQRLEKTTQTLMHVKTLLYKYRLCGSDYQSLLQHTIEPMVAMGLCANKISSMHSYLQSIHKFTSVLQREFSLEMRTLSQGVI